VSRPTSASARNARIAAICVVGVLGMTGASFAAVPLYRLFCQVTGFDGTVRKADAAPTRVLDRKMDIRFDTNVNGVPFDFEAEQLTQTVQVGRTAMAFFKVTNRSDKAVKAQAMYNVVPEDAGAWFQKMQCFCFEEQTLEPGETVEFPMVYFVDPSIADEKLADGIEEITLSYTFFPVPEPTKLAAR
jgi:cytochrome c oxidase assembly protein subunit 11